MVRAVVKRITCLHWIRSFERTVASFAAMEEAPVSGMGAADEHPGWRFFRDTLRGAKYHVAPMVRASTTCVVCGTLPCDADA